MLLTDLQFRFLLIASLLAASEFVHPAESASKSSDLRLVVVSNGVAILPCESRADSSSVVQYSWTKDNLPIDVGNDGRIQITNEGHLLLKDAMEEDSGVYVCQAVSNNDIIEVNVTLIVLVPDAPPVFTNFTFPNVTLERNMGSSVILRCPVRGHPIPEISWFKDGIQVEDPMTRDPDTEIKIGKCTVTLQNLQPSDSGNYMCIATNELGTVNGTFHLHVIKKEKNSVINTTRPDLSVFHPLNTTVKYGSSATFQCRVRSEAPPNIQWLKKVEDSELQSLQKGEHDIIKVQGENYRVLQSSEVVEGSDGSFLNKLTIPEVYEADSGKYICLGANSMGYSFRSAYLTVLPRPHALPLGWSRSVAVHPGHPSSLLVAIPITLGILVGVLVALVVLCHRRRMDISAPLPASGYRKEDPKKSLCTTDTSLDKIEEEKQLESANFSADEAEDYKEEGPSASHLHSEVELEGSGVVVTKLCSEQNSSNNYDGCFIMRNEV